MIEGLDRLRAFLDRRTAVAVLGTAGGQAPPEVAMLAAPSLTSDGHIAGGEEEGVGGRAFRNLRQNSRATLLVLDPIMDPRARDGVRVTVEFLGAEEDGDELHQLSQWLSTFAPGRRMVRRLIFKVLAVEPYRITAEGPILQR
jgi:hypothetical protein